MTTVCLVGGGVASAAAASTLRFRGFDGRIVLVTDEQELPYERPPLSKEALAGTVPFESIISHPGEWWIEHHVDVLLGTRVRSVDAVSSLLELDTGDTIAYDRVLIATGGRARRIPAFEVDPRVLSLRTMADARSAGALLAELKKSGGRVAVIGGGFIGCEVASTARSIDVEVTVIDVLDVLLQRALGRRYGSLVTGVAEAAGVDVRCGESVEGVVAAGERLAIRTRSGEVDADMVVVAAGMIPNTELLESSGVELANGAIIVDEHCRTSVANVFAAGDVVCQVRPGHDTPIRVEHQDTAQRQGRVAALAMLGVLEADPTPDWFWSDQFGLSIQSVGRFDSDGDHVVRGTPEDRSFTAFQTDGDRLIGAMSIGRPADIRIARRLIASGVEVDLARLGDADSNLKEIAMARSTS